MSFSRGTNSPDCFHSRNNSAPLLLLLVFLLKNIVTAGALKYSKAVDGNLNTCFYLYKNNNTSKFHSSSPISLDKTPNIS